MDQALGIEGCIRRSRLRSLGGDQRSVCAHLPPEVERSASICLEVLASSSKWTQDVFPTRVRLQASVGGGWEEQQELPQVETSLYEGLLHKGCSATGDLAS